MADLARLASGTDSIDDKPSQPLKLADIKVSARRSPEIEARSSNASPPNARNDPRNIFRRCPKAAAVTRSIAANKAAEGCSAFGTMPTTAEYTLGGGVKALGGIRIISAVVQVHCASTASRPYASLSTAAAIRSATSS